MLKTARLKTWILAALVTALGACHAGAGIGPVHAGGGVSYNTGSADAPAFILTA
jgi:hypothetical protein